MATDAQAIAEFCHTQARELRHTAARLGNDPLFIHLAKGWERDAESWQTTGRPASAL